MHLCEPNKKTMKKLLFFALFASLIVACSNPTPQGNLVINGNVRGLKKGTIYLQKIKDTTLVVLDSMVLAGDGAFSFGIELEEPEVLYLYLNKKDQNEFNDRIALFAEEGTITVDTKWNTFDINPKISGSKAQEHYETYKKMMSRFNEKNLALIQQALAYSEARDTAKMDSVQELNNRNELRRYLFAINFALNNKDSYIAPYIATREIPNANPKFLDSIYSVLPENIAQSKYGKELSTLLDSIKE